MGSFKVELLLTIGSADGNKLGKFHAAQSSLVTLVLEREVDEYFVVGDLAW